VTGTFAGSLARDHAARESALAVTKGNQACRRAMTASCSVLTTQEPGNVTGHITGRLTAAAELRRDG
jgi:hypothetical protein